MHRPITGLKLIVHPAQAFLAPQLEEHIEDTGRFALAGQRGAQRLRDLAQSRAGRIRRATHCRIQSLRGPFGKLAKSIAGLGQQSASVRSEEHTSELPSLMRISYAVFCLKKQTKIPDSTIHSLISKLYVIA